MRQQLFTERIGAARRLPDTTPIQRYPNDRGGAVRPSGWAESLVVAGRQPVRNRVVVARADHLDLVRRSISCTG